MHGSGRHIRPNAAKNPEGTACLSSPLLRGGGVWLCAGGGQGLADPLSPADLAGAHPLWAADVARLAPWEEVVLGPEAGPAAGVWLAARGPAGETPVPVLVVGGCTSGLDVGWRLAEAGLLPPFASVVAVTQRQGRGQMRREWHSPPGNLYAALAWPTHAGDLGAMAPVLVGHCLAEALDTAGFSTEVKWPNDLLLEGGKVGGILLEERGGRTLAGIGLNCASAPAAAALRRDHAAPATSLADHGGVPNLEGTWAGLVQRVQTCYRQCVMLSDSGKRSRLLARHLAWLGREVLVHETEAAAFRARIIGLAEDGGLRLRRTDSSPGLELTLHCGSLSLF